MSAFAPSDLLTAWTADPVGLALVALAAVPYALLVRRAGRAGLRPSAWRVALYALVGVGSLAWAGCGGLAVHRADVFWVGALRVGVLATVTPVGIALGDPVGLLRRLHPDGAHVLLRILHGRVSRALTFPAASTALATGTLLLVFVTPVFTWSVTSRVAGAGLDVVLLGTGLLFVVPLLTDDLLPPWATPPVRTALAFVDGLLDAVPGIVVMTATTILSPGYPGFSSGVSGLDPLQDQRLGGGALLAVAEAVGLPVIAAVFLDWIRTDEQDARTADLLADRAAAAAPTRRPAGSPEVSHASDAPGLWWESDPRLAGRYRRTPAPDDASGPPPPQG